MGGQGIIVIGEKNKTIKVGFMVYNIWPLNHVQLWLESLVLVRCSLQQKRKEQKMHTNQMQQESNNNGDEAKVATNLLNIVGTFQAVFAPTPTT
jgi:hypothetical protein